MTFAKQRCCQSKSPISSAIASSGRPAARARRALTIITFTFALLLPKCPLCFGAWVAALGIGATWQHYLAHTLSPQMRPVLIALLVSPLLIQLAFFARGVLRRLDSGASIPSRELHPNLYTLLFHSKNR